jgi:hypothetical protein
MYMPINLTASLTLDPRHAGTTLMINAAAGLTITLPPATGSGYVYKFVVGTTVTSNSAIIRVTGNDVMTGLAISAADGGSTVNGWETAADSDTITLNGSTTGGIRGDVIELIDCALDTWSVVAHTSSTGTEATPFSATVS